MMEETAREGKVCVSAHGKDERHMRDGAMQVANLDLNIDG